MNALDIRAGPKALAHLRQHGLRAQDITIVPAAAFVEKPDLSRVQPI